MSEAEVGLGLVLLVMFLAGGMGIMHNVFRGGQRDDGSYMETPQEAVDAGTPWALLSIVAALVCILILLIAGGGAL